MANKKTKRRKLPLYDSLVDFDTSLDNEFLGYDTPKYIDDNLTHQLRDYQAQAFRFYHYASLAKQFNYVDTDSVLFNMATGSGKTDLMAALILYLYQEHNYQHFVFTVNTTSVLKKTVDNLTNPASDKYLYQRPIEIEGKRIHIEAVEQFPSFPKKNVIYIKLDTVQGLASDIFTEKENTDGIQEYKRNKTVILADEAHHYSASTKSEKEAERSWERTIDLILESHPENRLLEFTATIDLNNEKIYKKYKDQIIYQYALDRYIRDGYSKNIRRIQSSNTDRDNMMNAILLSEFRRRYANEFHDTRIKPVILFKSPRIKDSLEAEENFNQLIDELTPNSLESFVSLRHNDDTESFSETLYRTYNYYLSNKEILPEIVREIKWEFALNRIINANTSNMLENEQYQLLNTLESPNNLYRTVFAVAKLTEGWDVLNLYDIVRLSDSPAAKGTKNSTNSEAQLIGRGARYNPFILDGERSYTRRFEDDSRDSLLLETLHYHTINEPQYLKNLVASLDAMDLPTGEDKKNPPIPVKLKESFKKTELYRHGKIYYNETIQLEDSYYDDLAKYGIDNSKDIYIEWRFGTRELSYAAQWAKKDFENVHNIAVKIDKRLLMKAMNRNSFFHFNNLKQYLPLLRSREEFLGEKWLNFASRTLYATAPNQLTARDLTAKDCLEILEDYLKELEQKIRKGYRKAVGTNKFKGFAINEYVADYNKRVPNYDTGRFELHGTPLPQQVNRREYNKEDDFFVYDSAIINQTEAQLVDQIRERVSELGGVYDDVYLIRMDESMHRESAKNDKLKLYQFDRKPREVHFEAFQPDFILLLNNSDFFMQIFIEPKGINLLEKEQWKEDLLQYINANEGELAFEDDIDGVKIKGLKFYTINDGRDAINQLGEIALDKEFKGLSFE